MAASTSSVVKVEKLFYTQAWKRKKSLCMSKKFVRVYNYTSSATNQNGLEGSSLSSIKLTNACEPVNHMEATQFICSALALQLNLNE